MRIIIFKRFPQYLFSLLFLLIFFILVGGGNVPVGAENPSLDYTDGTVVGLFKDKIVILEYNFDKDESQEATYLIDPDLGTKDRTAFEKLTVGDEVEIYFYPKNGQKIAQVVSKEVKSDEAEFDQQTDSEGEDEPAGLQNQDSTKTK